MDNLRFLYNNIFTRFFKVLKNIFKNDYQQYLNIDSHSYIDFNLNTIDFNWILNFVSHVSFNFEFSAK